MDLGRSLRQALSKFTGAPVADEKAVKALCRELQRVLISSDVNVRLVFDLTKRIENRALDANLPKGLSLREHVVKVVYEELSGMMGERYEPKVSPKKILLLGLFGSGKCVHPDTMVPLCDGSAMTIKELYESTAGPEDECGSGTIKKSDIGVFSFDPESLKMVRSKGTFIWKLKKTEPLRSVWLDNGSNEKITATPEHPFFTLKNGTILQKRADELALGDFVALPGRLPIEPINTQFNFLNTLPASVRLLDKNIAVQLRGFLKSKFGTLQRASSLSNRPYCRISAELKAGEADCALLSTAMAQGFATKFGETVVFRGGRKDIRFPTTLTPALAEFMGYFYGDGHMERRCVNITNKDDDVVERVMHLGKTLFGLEPGITPDPRNIGLRRVTFASKTLVDILHGIFGLPIGKKSRTMRLPKFMMRSDSACRHAFLRAYFDCDGYVENGTRHIEFSTASRHFAYQLRLLLLSEGISSAYSTKQVDGWTYHRVFLRGKETEDFAALAGSAIRKKSDRLLSLSEIGIGQTEGKLENLNIGNTLMEVREYFGASIGELQKNVSSYGVYESRGVISRKALRGFLKTVKSSKNANNHIIEACAKPATFQKVRLLTGHSVPSLNASIARLREQGYVQAYDDGQLVATHHGTALLEKNRLFDLQKPEFLELLANSDIKWGKVCRLEIEDSEEYVYDLTVDRYHNFVANNFIVHNTTAAGKIAHFYKSRGLSVGLISCDVDRPAAYEQLQQLSKQTGAAFYGIQGEHDVKKILADAKARAKEDVLITDSAGRSAFDTGLVEQLKVINETFLPDERFLVISADIGQVAGKQASEFHSAVGLTGVIITKLDGSGKGGGALSAVSSSGAKVAFIGTGEKMDALEPFDAQKFVGRLLGFPDIGALLEKVKKIADEQNLPAEMEDKLTLRTFYEQLKAAKKLGPLSGVFSMLGAADVPADMVKTSEGKLKKYECIISSMTKAEMEDAGLVRKSRTRIERIAAGSGTKPEDVRELLTQFERVNGMFSQFKKNRGFRKKMEKMMKGANIDMSKFGG
ncbi:MAG: LAGLIDADG family homing endonuclease [Candidatus Micrarchaeia archaeon]